MSYLDRIAIGSRGFCLSAAVALAVLSGNLSAVQSTLLLSALAVGITWLTGLHVVGWTAAAGIESAVAGVLIGLSSTGHAELLPYLIAPSMIAGFAGGLFPLLLSVALEALAVMLLTADDVSLQHLLSRAEATAPWLIIGLGAGLLGAWIRVIGLGPAPASSHMREYEAARRLVTQLRSVARRLPGGGLDPVGIAEQLQRSLEKDVDVIRSAVFVRNHGGQLTPLTYAGSGARERLTPENEVVWRCWTEESVVRLELTEPGERARAVLALPLATPAGMVGVALIEATALPPTDGLHRLSSSADEGALRLDAALAFDEVRSIATMEERQRLAREIHDGIAQEVASLGYIVDDLCADAVEPTQVKALLGLREELTRVVHELRMSIFGLRTGAETTASLGTALSDFVQRVGAQSTLKVQITLDESAMRLRSEVESELLRIAQEAITNARKHAQAENLWVRCTVQPPFAEIIVEDDGGGLGEGRVDSYGLKIMQERAARVGADLSISDKRVAGQRGTKVTVTLAQEQTHD